MSKGLSRQRLNRLQGHTEKAFSAIQAIGMICGGVVAVVAGVRAVCDAMSPPASPTLPTTAEITPTTN